MASIFTTDETYCIVEVYFCDEWSGRMDKAQLRKNVIQQLKGLSEEEHTTIEHQIHKHVFATQLWKEAETIGITISQEGIEWDTKAIIEQAWSEGKSVAIPKCLQETRAMQFYEFKSYDELEVVYYGLKEPQPQKSRLIDKNDMDLLFVPGVVFDALGYRIGFGGGYYDRFLTDFHHTTVSLVSTVQLISEVPKENHDIAVDYLVTEKEII